MAPARVVNDIDELLEARAADAMIMRFGLQSLLRSNSWAKMVGAS